MMIFVCSLINFSVLRCLSIVVILIFINFVVVYRGDHHNRQFWSGDASYSCPAWGAGSAAGRGPNFALKELLILMMILIRLEKWVGEPDWWWCPPLLQKEYHDADDQNIMMVPMIILWRPCLNFITITMHWLYWQVFSIYYLVLLFSLYQLH